jgi:hypothetical protein
MIGFFNENPANNRDSKIAKSNQQICQQSSTTNSYAEPQAPLSLHFNFAGSGNTFQLENFNFGTVLPTGLQTLSQTATSTAIIEEKVVASNEN